jgi:phage terminase small subunit
VLLILAFLISFCVQYTSYRAGYELTKDAGIIAGLNVAGIIDEQTAAPPW